MKRLQLSRVVTVVVIGGLVSGGLAPLIGADNDTTAESTSLDFLTEGGGGGSTGSVDDPLGTDGSGGALDGGSTTGPGGRAGAGGSGGAGGRGSDGGTNSASDEPRQASDIGITADTIRLGAFVVNCKSCAAFGADIDPNDPPVKTVPVAFTNEINARGGIQGRRLEMFTRDYDPVDDAVQGGGSQREGCLDLAKDKKVFAVIGGPIQEGPCIYEEHKTLMISNITAGGQDPDAFNRNEGRVWVTEPTNERAVYDWGRQIVAQKLLPPGAKWGIVLTGPPASGVDWGAMAERVLLGYLKEHGYTPTHVSKTTGDFATIPVGVANEVREMQRKDVTHVLMGVPYIGGGEYWVREAQTNGWKPQYLASDFMFNGSELAGDEYEENGDWNGAIVVSTQRYYHVPELRGPLSPADKRCVDIWEKQSGLKTSQGMAMWVFAWCNYFQAFEAAMNKAGVNPTRRSVSQALASLGEFPMGGAVRNMGSFGGPYAFGPVKWSAATYGQRWVYRTPCPLPGNTKEGCNVAEGAPYPLTG